MTIEKVAVLGGGLMGSGIAEAVAVAGVPVVVRDVDAVAVGAVEKRIGTSLERARSRGKIDDDAAAAIRGRIELTTELDDVAGADLVIEAVPENAELKARILAEVAGRVGPETLIASNTSSIPIAQLAAGIERPERVLGLHFFSPVPVMGLVEIVVALDTSEETIAAASGFAERIGKKPIVTKDRSGFIVNMLLVPYLMAAVRMYEEGFATAESIDEGMKLGCGHPMGPLTLSDFIGLDVLYAIGDSLYEEFKRTEYAPPPLLKRMVASGRIGRKADRGFYEYGASREPVAA
ncbi:MAG TPA: 3-hydroxybutyryl-CoA dehydrogenase [Solirubrobacterales bacterium]|jgi:3-hydroxybutyryl-CoA dehydrogenase|nr:3-hydroxybutyryl-CoA dehydrogenase [Solirubrobacterales bacterium]